MLLLGEVNKNLLCYSSLLSFPTYKVKVLEPQSIASSGKTRRFHIQLNKWLLTPEELERQVGFHSSTQDEAWLSCPNSAWTLRSDSEMERNHEVPASTRDKALFYCTKPSGVRSGPSQLHSIPDFSEAPWKAPWGHGHKSTEPRVSCRNLRKTSRVLHASWGPIPLPWLEKNDALPLATRMKIWLPRHCFLICWNS